MKIRKILALLLSASMLAGLAACGSSSSSSSSSSADSSSSETSSTESGDSGSSGETVELNLVLRSGTYADVIKECLPAFEEEYNVVCNVQELSEDDLYSNIAYDATNAEGAYDLCMVDGSWMAEFTEYGVLANLSELGYELDDDIIPATTTICYYEGDVYLAPYYGNVTVLLFNKENVEAAGYDADSIDSLDDILAICQYAQENGNKGFIYRGDSQNNLVVDFLPILLSFGGWVIDDDNQPIVDSDEFKAAMNFYLELIATGDAEVKDDLVASIDAGSGTMGIGWPGWYTPSDDAAADYIALTGATSDGAETYNANVYGIWTIGIPANGQNQELSIALLEYLMDADVQKSTIASGGVPCRYSSLQDEEVLEQYPYYEVVCEALENGTYRPVISEWTQFYTILGAEMDNIINGVKTVDEGLADAQANLEDLMG